MPTLIQTVKKKWGLRSMLMVVRSSPPEEVNRLALAMEILEGLSRGNDR